MKENAKSGTAAVPASEKTPEGSGKVSALVLSRSEARCAHPVAKCEGQGQQVPDTELQLARPCCCLRVLERVSSWA